MRIVLLSLVLSIAAQAAEPKPRQFLAGAATSNITPDIGTLVVGAMVPAFSTHVHDELQVRCIVLDNGDKRVAFAVCDLLGGARVMFDEAARLVHDETGLPRECLVMSCTHTHSAASALGADHYAVHAPLDDYQKFVARRIADGVKRAIHNLAPARIGWAVGSEPNEVFNRRWFMKPGSIPLNPFGGEDQVKMNPPRMSKDLIKPAGPTDPEICLVSIQSVEGKPLALLANYSLHYVGDVGPGHISADYFAAYADRMQQLLNADRQDPPFVAIMSNGTSGDINNNDVLHETPRGPAYSRIRTVADIVAQDSLKAMQGITYHDWIPLDARFRDLEVAVRHPTPEMLERARKLADKPRAPWEKARLEIIYAERTIGMATYPPTIKIPIQALRIGEVGIATSPCETFAEIGLELKARSPFKPSFTIEIANDYLGYLPTPEQHKLGGYETWLGTNRLEELASVKLTEALLSMWKEMR